MPCHLCWLQYYDFLKQLYMICFVCTYNCSLFTKALWYRLYIVKGGPFCWIEILVATSQQVTHHWISLPLEHLTIEFWSKSYHTKLFNLHPSAVLRVVAGPPIRPTISPSATPWWLGHTRAFAIMTWPHLASAIHDASALLIG